MSTQESRMQALEGKVSKLARRVEQLEQRPRRGEKRPVAGDAGPVGLLEHLRSRKSGRYRAKDMSGAIAYGGAVVLGDRECLWIRELPLPEIDDMDPIRLARALTALGHPARLTLVRALMKRTHTSQELQDLLEVSSPGQLYHHLKELLTAGIATQTRRSQYEIANRQVVPVLTILAAAFDLVDAQAAPSDPVAPGKKES